MEPQGKRRKIDRDCEDASDSSHLRHLRSAFLSRLDRPVSPPLRQVDASSTAIVSSAIFDGGLSGRTQHLERTADASSSQGKVPPGLPSTTSNLFQGRSGLGQELHMSSREMNGNEESKNREASRYIPSPFKLTSIRDLPQSANIDTINIKDILGDPLIQQAWVFNFCFDVDWLMSNFDDDVRELVEVFIVHGSWRREDGNKIHIDEACNRFSNVRTIQAYLPDAFGTHHAKMFVLLRHDDCAQVVIHTANMLAGDWGNATQAVWSSPLLPKTAEAEKDELRILGSGSRFKHDLLAYLRSYGRGKLAALIKQLTLYDFSAVHAVLIASVPSKITERGSASAVLWGHLALERALRALPSSGADDQLDSVQPDSEIFCQVSSIATFTKEWLTDTLFRALCPTGQAKFAIIFPTTKEVRESLNGYGGGASIHLKAQSAAHQKQIEFIRPYLRHWDSSPAASAAQRSLAAPHIKTYICFNLHKNSSSSVQIRWALLTSSNLSVQAWGTAWKSPSKKEKDEGFTERYIHIQSYELGVLVWPELFDVGQGATMEPTFGKDVPEQGLREAGQVIGLRMAYDLPLKKYGEDEQPWSPNLCYPEPDSHGSSWPMSFT